MKAPTSFAYTCADEGSQPHTCTYMGMDLGGAQEHDSEGKSALSTHTHTRTHMEKNEEEGHEEGGNEA